ncbi:MAG TPA: outer membrane beta-barrel protein [Dysgonamonadaceae bacterium]|nr:outer membrane beta-barrel protein [Dysgonamonadaceae bacterium]HRS41275.1 outer membrane beta-barrel protein [Dysgonamonadaceae bacterium]HRU13060.1 outer membrane beta-barrel protein [Dysgonamonadaceae bacterium]
MKIKNTLIKGIVFSLVIIFSLPATSQVRFGVNARVGLNNPSFNSDALNVDNLTDYAIGPSLQIMLPVPIIDLGIEASLLYQNSRMNIQNLEGTSTTSEEISNQYLMLPINAKIFFGKIPLVPIHFYAAAGPYFGYLINGDKINLENAAEDIVAKKFEAGANIGAGIEVFKLIQVGVNYGVKLTDNYGTDKPDWNDPLNGKTSSWTLNASIYF